MAVDVAVDVAVAPCVSSSSPAPGVVPPERPGADVPAPGVFGPAPHPAGAAEDAGAPDGPVEPDATGAVAGSPADVGGATANSVGPVAPASTPSKP
ncbi:MAG TPA: hypothetical protein VEH82_11830 [Acidimicrobiales bacterium]|nr:hypothetical protein [Acidimicrobiales bacterium]